MLRVATMLAIQLDTGMILWHKVLELGFVKIDLFFVMFQEDGEGF